MKSSCLFFLGLVMAIPLPIVAGESDWTVLEKQFRDVPMEARQHTGPLFWMHGDETRQQLERELKNVLDGHNGTFTMEPRPHKDWLGEGWYADVGICLNFARQNNLTCYIYDDYWWPSQMMGGRVPAQYGSKVMQASFIDVEGGKTTALEVISQTNLIAVIGGRIVGEDTVDAKSLTNLTALVKAGQANWTAPEGRWKVMTFSWKFKGKEGGQQRFVSVDGASPDCVDWFIQTVYQPHYDRFKEDFGKTIVGYFYDEPETQGDWGSEVPKVISERGFDLATLLVAYKFKLAGEVQTAAYYSYLDCFAEAWGRVMYGGMSRWCRAHNVVSMGHFMEHENEIFNRSLSAGNMMQLLKFSDMGAIDLVCDQVYPGERKMGMYQMPKIASSISHTYNKSNDIAACEIFGGYGQKLTYPQMKWLCDWEQVRGINYMIPHSFNPRAPFDSDYPPYFNNGGFEPRWPLYRIWADYNNRLSLLLTGGRHVAPVAFLHLGQSYHVGNKERPEELTSALQDALYDCDWLLYDAWEKDAVLDGTQIRLHKENYSVLVVPAAEVVPFPTLAKAKEFFDKGGVVLGYGILPSKSATPGHSNAEMMELCNAIWGTATPGLARCKSSANGGRSYFLPLKPTPEQLQQVLAGDAKIHPTLEVVAGDTGHWLHVLNRQKDGCDIFLICNQNHQGLARTFTFKVTASGEPECWDAMRNEITIPNFKRVDENHVDVDLTLEPSESVLLVFRAEKHAQYARRADLSKDGVRSIPLFREPVASMMQDRLPNQLLGSSWVWYPEGNPAVSAPAGSVYFRKSFITIDGKRVKTARIVISADNEYVLFVNGAKVAQRVGETESWKKPDTIDITSRLTAGSNVVAVVANNTVESPAGLIGRVFVEYTDGMSDLEVTDASWKVSRQDEKGWSERLFNDSGWLPAKVVAALGEGPWGNIGTAGIESPVKADPYAGRFTIPVDVDMTKNHFYLELEDLAPEAAAHVTVNNRFAGGFIGKPFRLDVTRWVEPGKNSVSILPFAPTAAHLLIVPK